MCKDIHMYIPPPPPRTLTGARRAYLEVYGRPDAKGVVGYTLYMYEYMHVYIHTYIKTLYSSVYRVAAGTRCAHLEGYGRPNAKRPRRSASHRARLRGRLWLLRRPTAAPRTVWAVGNSGLAPVRSLSRNRNVRILR